MTSNDAPTSQTLRVSAPARLHMGFLDPEGYLGRKFASVGLAISNPATNLTIKRADRNSTSGLEADRALRQLEQFQKALSIDGAFAVEVTAAIPAHAGLGSGTQLALAIGAALQTFSGNPVLADHLGAIVDRGARSAIGITSFAEGGFIIDGGKKDRDRPPPVIARTAFPEDWRIVLALDHDAQGIHGENELEAFSELKPLPRTAAAHLCHLAAMKLLPALHDHDLTNFGSAITEIQQIIGGYFAPMQGGRAFSSARVESVVQKMGTLGGHGLGQSSWGPTGYAFFESQDAAERLFATLVEDAKASGVDLMIVQGRNRGAEISAL